MGDEPTRPALTFLTDLKLRRTGSLAWIVRRTPIDIPLAPYPRPADGRPDFQVRKADRRGEALLDAGYDIVPGSLRLSGATLSWLKGGTTHSAVID